jgi:hypothetical protein
MRNKRLADTLTYQSLETPEPFLAGNFAPSTDLIPQHNLRSSQR